MPLRHLFIVIAILLPAASVAPASEETKANLLYLEELRNQGEIERVEAICRHELKRDDLGPAARADYTIALMRSLVDRGLTLPPEERTVLFNQAEAAAAAFGQAHPDAPRGVLVRFQSAVTAHMRGEIARLEAEADGDARRSFDTARQILRVAVRRFEVIHADVEAMLREPRPPAGFTRNELVNLEKSTRHRRAESLTDLSRCYPSQSPDRIDLLSRASELLAPLSGGDPRHPLTWQARIDRIRGERLLGHYNQAAEQLRALAATDPPEETRLLALAESIRLALDAGRLDEAVTTVRGLPPFESKHPRALATAALETALEARRASQNAGNVAEAEAWTKRTETLLSAIDRLYGPYWSRRARMRAAKLAGDVQSGDSAMLVRAAELALEEDRPDDAIGFYDRARAAASTRGDAGQSFELGYAAAAVEHRRKRSAEALRRFRETAVAAAENPLAPEAHLLAAWHAGRLFEQTPGDVRAETVLTDVLNEHLRLWPDAATADKVRYQLGLLHERAGRPAEAIEVYQRIASDFPSYPAVLQATGRCVQELAKRTPSDAGRLASDAAAWFENLVYGPDGTMPQRWSPVARTAAVEAARFHLETPDGASDAEKLLRPALADSKDASAKWRSDAEMLLVAALTAEGKQDEALALTQARLEKVDAKQHATLERTQAELLAKTGDREAATAAFERLAEKYPKDAAVRRRLAELLAEGSTREDWEASLAQWRALAEGLRPDTPAWFEAKYRTAEMQARLGNRKTAARIITVLRITRPELGGAEMKQRFLKLLESVR